MARKRTQLELLMECYKANPNRDISHPEIVDWVTTEWSNQTGKVFRDPDRGIRKLHQDGLLIKVSKGVYHYSLDVARKVRLEDFTAEQKSMILERDNFKCVICGRGKKDGVELHVDHIKPKDRGGQATIENGQILCAQHSFIKKI